MTNEEAIERFSVAVTATLNEEEQDLYRTAIKALEKQISVRNIVNCYQCAYCRQCAASTSFEPWFCEQHQCWLTDSQIRRNYCSWAERKTAR